MKFSIIECAHRLPKYETANSAVIFLHGYGSNGEDLISLADIWQHALPHTIFLSPNAPQRCAANPYGGYQWFPLNNFSHEELHTGVTKALPEINEFIDDVSTQLNIKHTQIVLVGFSQGTMMALHAAFNGTHTVRAIVGFSGMLIEPPKLSAHETYRPKVFLAHGDCDDVVPPQALPAALSVLNAHSIETQSYIAQGVGHFLDEEMLLRAGRFLVEQLAVE